MNKMVNWVKFEFVKKGPSNMSGSINLEINDNR